MAGRLHAFNDVIKQKTNSEQILINEDITVASDLGCSKFDLIFHLRVQPPGYDATISDFSPSCHPSFLSYRSPLIDLRCWASVFRTSYISYLAALCLFPIRHLNVFLFFLADLWLPCPLSFYVSK